MNLDDIFVPYLTQLFSEYLEDMEFSVEDAQEKGSEFFVVWLNETVTDPSSDEDEDEDEERTPEGDALFVLLSFLHDSPDHLWINDFWPMLLLAQRGMPRNKISELHISYVIRWADDRLFSFVCVVPPYLVSPKGILSDYLVTKIGHISATQFHDIIASTSLDVLHDNQQIKIPREDIDAVLQLAIDGAEQENQLSRRGELQNAIAFLRSAVIPPIPPEADAKARASLSGGGFGKGRWDVFPVKRPQDDE
jgi:hypothetical protein